MIREDYVNFEIAKLLKDIGFDEPTLYHYCQNNNFPTHTIDYECIKNSEDAQFCSAPTIQMAMKYLRKVYNLHITTKPYITTEGIMFVYEIYKLESDKFTLLKSKAGFKEPEEAVEAAIKYVLENLIKK